MVYDGPSPIIGRAAAKSAGLARYFTGKPCKHGHVAQRQTTNGMCWLCRKQPSKEYMAAWLARNPERRAAHTKKYWDAHKAEYKLYYERNFDRIHARNRAWRKANSEAYAKSVADWHKAHPEAVKRIQRHWVVSNPGKVAANDRAQRARRLNAEGKHTAAEILALMAKQNGRCAYCSTDIAKNYHADHIVPLVSGGSNWISNIQLTCPTCNMQKNRTDPLVFAARRGPAL
jgi:hypothetical protein